MNTTAEDTRRLADDTLDQLHGTLGRTKARVSEVAARGADRMRDLGEGMRDQMDRTAERTVGYVRDEPVKSLLMAAGVGALIAVAIAAMARNRY